MSACKRRAGPVFLAEWMSAEISAWLRNLVTTNLGFSAGSPVFSAFLGSSLPCLGCIHPVNARTDRADKRATRRSAAALKRVSRSAAALVMSSEAGLVSVSPNCKVCSKKGELACDFLKWGCFFIKEIILHMHNFFLIINTTVTYNVAYK